MINSMYNHNGNDITKNKPVLVIMVLTGNVDIVDSSVNAILHVVSWCLTFVCKGMQSRVTIPAFCMSSHPS